MTPRPHRSDAHMRIAHTVFEALYRSPVNRIECQVFCLLLRRSWGFSSKTVAISTEAIATELERNQRNVQIALKDLVACNMVSVIKTPCRCNPGVYAPNKMFAEWNFSHRLDDQCDRANGISGRSIRSRKMSSLIAQNVEFDRANKKQAGEEPDGKGVCGTTNTCSKKLFKESTKENPPTPQGVNEAGGTDDCLDETELVPTDPRNEGPGSRDKSKLASLLTLAQVRILTSTCLQDLQRIEPVLVPRAKAKLDEYLSTLPPAEWKASPQRWASHLRHWIQIGVSEVQAKIRELMGMSEDYKASRRVKFPADMAIQIAARLCGEKLAEFSEDERGQAKNHATRI